MSRLKKFQRTAAVLALAIVAVTAYLVRGGFHRFDITPYPVPPPAFTNWNDVLAHPGDISLRTLQTGVVHMDACLNLDPASPKQSDCDHRPRDLAVRSGPLRPICPREQLRLRPLERAEPLADRLSA